MFFFRSFYIKRFFTRLYQTFQNQGWSVIAKAPTYLNVALPDFSVQYIIASFQRKDEVYIRGIIPKASYVSLVVYDTFGLPQSYLYLDRTKSVSFTMKMGIDLPFPSTNEYAIILRIYQLQEPFTYPSIFVNQKKIKPLLKSTLYENSLKISSEIIDILSRTLHLKISMSQKFFKPVHSQTRGLFINPDAVYLVSSPNESRVMCVSGHLPPRNSSLCFVGFMACNLTTTETDDSIGWDDLDSTYRIYVSHSIEKAIEKGYDPNQDKLLLWKDSNPSPILVYREVNLEHNGIFNLQSEKWQEAKRIMKSFYPEIEFFTESSC